MTGIRGVAAVWVMLYHAQLDAGKYYNLPFLHKIPDMNNGWRGVDLFFMLSGFILMYAHERDFHVIRKASLIRFARLRFARVYPLNAVVLLLIAAFVAFQPGFVAWSRVSNPADFSLESFVRTLFLATRWFLPRSGDWNQPVWSLSLEVLGYAIFPFVAYFVLRVTRIWPLIAMIGFCLFTSLVYLELKDRAITIDQIAVVRMLVCFLTGIAVFRIWTLTAESTAKKWAAWISAVSAVGILAATWSAWGGAAVNLLFALLLYGLAFQRGVVNRLLSSRIAMYLGNISFPLYLTHVVPLLWLHYFFLFNGARYSTFEKLAVLMCWAIGCFLMATLLHHFVENPFHELGRRWAGARVPNQT
jgi:peptidoglycan/LPS O-acetylase OafA/YrhL